MRILGSTDFLGNPSGLLADVSEGMSELMHEGSLQGFVWNVTHGMANSAAKVSGECCRTRSAYFTNQVEPGPE